MRMDSSSARMATLCNLLTHPSERGRHCRNSPGVLEFDPEKNSTKLIFSGYVQNINRNNISKVPKFPPCAKFVTAIFQNGRLFGKNDYFILFQIKLHSILCLSHDLFCIQI